MQIGMPWSRWSKRRELEPGTSKLFYLLFGPPIGRGAGRRSEEMVVLRSEETIVVVGRPIGRDLGGPPIGSRFKSEPVWPL